MTHGAIGRIARAVLIAVAGLLAATSPIGRPARAALAGDQSISQIVTAWAQRDAVQEFSLAVWRGGRVIESLGYGGWDPAKRYPVAGLSKAVRGLHCRPRATTQAVV